MSQPLPTCYVCSTGAESSRNLIDQHRLEPQQAEGGRRSGAVNAPRDPAGAGADSQTEFSYTANLGLDGPLESVGDDELRQAYRQAGYMAHTYLSHADRNVRELAKMACAWCEEKLIIAPQNAQVVQAGET